MTSQKQFANWLNELFVCDRDGVMAQSQWCYWTNNAMTTRSALQHHLKEAEDKQADLLISCTVGRSDKNCRGLIPEANEFDL